MKKNILTHSLFTLFLVAGFSCKKDPGPGGNCSIRGKVMVKKYDPNFFTLQEEYPGADTEVYIVYGDEYSFGDRIRADYEGDFEFKYVRKGKYKIYTYSRDSTAIKGPPANPNAPLKAVVKEIEITGKKQTVDAGTLVILKN